ncbi:ribulose 1,5-bisphosphate carboxylase [Verrucomicrobia bacterium LW23]|nr:ribulose 1,5-bisphosphate carboxylase [Verrucomicrobia bacterium LW23]
MTTPADTLVVQYRVQSSAAEIEKRVESLLLEQTVEMPRAAVADSYVKSHIIGKVGGIVEGPEGNFTVTLLQPARTTANDPAQFLNVLFGNSSIQPDVVLTDFEVPDALSRVFAGPRFGIKGLRSRAGVKDGALTCTALKPMGLTAHKMAELCATFASAGLHYIKDDHGLANHDFCAFDERVQLCQRAVNIAAERTGHQAIYVPNLIGTPSTVLKQLSIAQEAGVRAVMVEPMLLGLPFFAELVQQHLSVPVLAHPSFSGALRMTPQALGKLLRLYGADAVIFPNFGGRFSYSKEDCGEMAAACTSAWEGIRASAPTPAGGIKFNQVEATMEFYGDDVMLLIGGSLLEAGAELHERSLEFVRRVRKRKQVA